MYDAIFSDPLLWKKGTWIYESSITFRIRTSFRIACVVVKTWPPFLVVMTNYSSGCWQPVRRSSGFAADPRLSPPLKKTQPPPAMDAASAARLRIPTVDYKEGCDQVQTREFTQGRRARRDARRARCRADRADRTWRSTPRRREAEGPGQTRQAEREEGKDPVAVATLRQDGPARASWPAPIQGHGRDGRRNPETEPSA